MEGKLLETRKENKRRISKICQIYDISEITKDDKQLVDFLKKRKVYHEKKNQTIGVEKHSSVYRLISDNPNFIEELSDYFYLYIDSSYTGELYHLLAPIARNLIPDIITLRRKKRSHFKMRLLYADWDHRSEMVNYIFISIDENNTYDDKIVIECINGNKRILE